MDVVRRQRMPGVHQPVDPRAGGQQFHQRLLAGDDQRARPLLDQRDVADELERIPQALLAVQQDRPAGVAAGADGCGDVSPGGHAGRGAIPGRRWEGRSDEVLALPTPLVLGPAVGEIACKQPGQGPAQVGVGSLRLQADRLLVLGRRRLGFSLGPQGLGQLEMGLGVVRAELEGLAATGHGLVQLAHFGVDDAQIEMGLGVLGIDSQGLPVAGDRLGEPAEPAADRARLLWASAKPGCSRTACWRAVRASSKRPNRQSTSPRLLRASA